MAVVAMALVVTVFGLKEPVRVAALDGGSLRR